MKPNVVAAQRPPPPRSVSPGTAPPPPETRSRAQQAMPDLAHVRHDLIMVGTVAGVTILIMIILWLVL